MSQREPIDAFLSDVRWDLYAGATYALSFVAKDGVSHNLACRIVLRLEEAPPEWDFAFDFEGLSIRRGWFSTIELRTALASLQEDHLLVAGNRVRFRADEGHGKYSWILNSNLGWLRKRIGWPSIQLKGWGGEQSHRCGYALHDRVARHLPVAKPRPFRGWEGVAAFLGGDAEPVPLGPGVRADFECYAPTYARIQEVDWGKHHPHAPSVAVECLLNPVPGDLTLLIDAGTADAPTSVALAEQPQTEPHLWEIPLDLPTQPERYCLMLAVDGQVVERVEPGDFDLQSPSLHQFAKSLRGSDPGEEYSEVESRIMESAPVAEGSRPPSLGLDLLHPTIVARCGDQLRQGYFDEAILNAFKSVEEELRRRSDAGHAVVGVVLATKALQPETGSLIVSAVPAEREGAHHLFRGALGFFKNPQSHRFVGVRDEHVAFELLAVASALMRILDAAERRAPIPRDDAPSA